MRCLLLAPLLFLVVFCAPLDDSEAKILQYTNENDGKGNYHFSFETSNGISRDEVGGLVDEGLPSQRIAVSGTYKLERPDGIQEVWIYTADENGYHQERLFDSLLSTPAPAAPASVSASLTASLLGK